MRVIACSCGDKFSTPWEIYTANGGALTPDQKDEFVRWLSGHGTPSHVKTMSLVEAVEAN
jgi:hypothetical protein